MDENETRSKLERLRAIRGGHRGVVTKIVKEIDEILGATPISREAKSRVNVVKQQLEGKLVTLTDLGNKILEICKTEEIENEIFESEEVETRIIEARRRIEMSANTTQQIHDASASSTSAEHVQPVQVQVQQNIATNSPNLLSAIFPLANTRLPKLTMPTFKGEITKWSTFWDSYKCAVHNNQALPKIDKFNYLKSLLEGSASRAVEGLTLTESNYDAAIKIHEDRFGKPQEIISAHMDELLKIQGCTDSERVSSLRMVYDKINVHTRGLASLGVETEQYGSLLIPVIMAKLPSDIRLRIAREVKNSVWKIDDLLKVIQQEVEAREISETVKATEARQQPPNRYKSPMRPTASTLLAGNEMQPRNTTIQCVYCNASHFSASCDSVTDARSRRNILIEAKRCFKCLKTGHQARECRKQKSCRNCGGPHHQSICIRSKETPNLEAEKPINKNEENDVEGKKYTSAVTTCAKPTTQKNTILLQTAKTTAVSQDGSKTSPVRILFDSGSQRSYVTNNLKERLRLKVTKNETLHLNTFGENGYRKQICSSINQLPLKTETGEVIEISALCFPVICSPLPTNITVKDYPHLKDLNLADCSNGHHSIDVLIGSDYYWDIVEGRGGWTAN